MRLTLPPKSLANQVKRLLMECYHVPRRAALKEAVELLCEYYKLRSPRIVWKRRVRLAGEELLGRCDDDGDGHGTIYLVPPEVWARRRASDNTDTAWVRTVLHEWHHHLYFVDAETKAEYYVDRFMMQ